MLYHRISNAVTDYTTLISSLHVWHCSLLCAAWPHLHL